MTRLDQSPLAKSRDTIRLVGLLRLAAGMHTIGWEKIMPVQATQNISVRQMNAEVQPQLEKMYHSYIPLGDTLGLPPVNPILRRRWLEDLGRGINLVCLCR
jgi:hypothetical protein